MPRGPANWTSPHWPVGAPSARSSTRATSGCASSPASVRGSTAGRRSSPRRASSSTGQPERTAAPRGRRTGPSSSGLGPRAKAPESDHAAPRGPPRLPPPMRAARRRRSSAGAAESGSVALSASLFPRSASTGLPSGAPPCTDRTRRRRRRHPCRLVGVGTRTRVAQATPSPSCRSGRSTGRLRGVAGGEREAALAGATVKSSRGRRPHADGGERAGGPGGSQERRGVARLGR